MQTVLPKARVFSRRVGLREVVRKKACLTSAGQKSGSPLVIFRLQLEPGQTTTHELKPGRGAWLQVADGALTVNGVELTTGDGASTEAPGKLTFTATRPVQALLFDLK